MLIKILIGFFIFLIGYQLFLALFKKDNLIEGLENKTNDEYKPYNEDPLILAKQNAGNIEVLKGRVDKLDGIKERVDSFQQIMDGMQTQIDGLVEQQGQYAKDIMSEEPSFEGTQGYDADAAVADMEEEEEVKTESVNL